MIDGRGRLFGKLNVIDALVLAVIVVLIPVAYGAYLLFRTPTPTISSVAPATLTQATLPATSLVVTLRGENLRPYLRARVGTMFVPFLIETPGVAELKIPGDIAPGTYDLALFDEAQQVAVKPGVLTVVPSQAEVRLSTVRMEVQAVGKFVGLTKEAAASIGAKSIFKAKTEAGPTAEVLALKAPQPGTAMIRIAPGMLGTATLPELHVPAIIRLFCTVANTDCKVGETVVTKDVTIALPGTGDRPVTFRIEQVFPAGMRASFPTVAVIRVRFVGEPEIVDVMKPGDADLADVAAPSDRGVAVLTQIGTDRRTMNAVTSTIGILNRSVQLDQPLLAFTGTVRVPLVYTVAGWTYKDRPVKVGAGFPFETTAGGMVGVILEMRLGQEK